MILVEVDLRELDGPRRLAAIRNLDADVPCFLLSNRPRPYTEAELLQPGAVQVVTDRCAKDIKAPAKGASLTIGAVFRFPKPISPRLIEQASSWPSDVSRFTSRLHTRSCAPISTT
jgi:hypothetical protein